MKDTTFHPRIQGEGEALRGVVGFVRRIWKRVKVDNRVISTTADLKADLRAGEFIL